MNISYSDISINRTIQNLKQNNKKMSDIAHLVTLELFNRTHFNGLKRLVQSARNMKHIQNGEIWNDERLWNKINMSEADEGDSKRQYWYWVIKYNGSIVGFVGIHPIKYDAVDDLFITILIGRRFRLNGLATAALNILKGLPEIQHLRCIYADVSFSNIASLNCLFGFGFRACANTVIAGDSHLRLYYMIPTNSD